MGQIFDNQGRTPFHYCAKKFDEFCRVNRCSGRADVQNKYQLIVDMIRYCLETIECDPDVGIKVTIDDNPTNTTTENIKETSIFYLLRNVSFANQTTEHPLDLFLKKTKNINILHHQTQRTPLLEAIHLKEYKTIDTLMRQSMCDLNLATSTSQDELQQTPLIVACKQHSFAVIRLLLNHPKCDLLAYDYQHNQALHYFLSTSNRSDEYLEIFHLFIEKLKLIDINTLNSQNQSGRTPLHISVYYNSGTVDTINEIEQTLIKNNCNLLIKDNLGNLPLHNVFLENKSSDDPVELCILLTQAMKYESLDIKNNEGNTPLHLAVMKGSTVCVMFLLKYHANLLSENNSSNSIIASCIASNHLNLLITFLHQPIDINLNKIYNQSNDKSISEPIVTDRQMSETDSSASSTSEMEVTSSEIENQDLWQWKFAQIPESKTDKQYSLIHLIIQRNWQGAISLILDDTKRFHLTYIQVFEAAIMNDRLHFILGLFKNLKDRTVLNETNSHGQNLFHIFASIQRFNREFFEKYLTFLYENHVDWNIPDKYGSYPLHYACVIQNIPFINFFQKKYSNELNFNQTDSFGNTAYGLLFWSSAIQTSYNKEFIQTLITSGKSLDCLCNYVNDIAIDHLTFGRIDSLSRENIPYPPNKSESTSTRIRTSPLINAIVYNHFQLVKFLLELGADINFSDELKRTPLMHAIQQNNIKIVKLLLNIQPDIINNDQLSKPKPSLDLPQTQKKTKSKGVFLGMTTTSTQNSDESDDENSSTSDHNDIGNNTETTAEISTIRTSTIDINASDTFGRTYIHYLVQPFPDGSYMNNTELLELLHKSGASLTKKDSAGLSPFDYSVMNGCQHLYDTLTKLIKEEPMDSTTMIIKRFIVNDPNKELLDLPDYYAEAQAYIDAQKAKETIKTVYQVDPVSNMSETGEVVIDTEKNEPYDVRLTITDVDYGLIGLYNFYRMQIIKHKTKINFYLLLTRWGRIGEGDGQHQLTPFSSFDECRKEFCKIFRNKTGNLCENINQFETKPKKYTLIQLNEHQKQKYMDVPIDFEQLQDDDQHPPSKLQSSVYKNLFETFLDPRSIRAYLQKTQLDIEWMPVSQLKPESLQKARDILTQLKQNIEEKEKLKLIIQQSESTNENKQTIDPVQKAQFKLLLDCICKLTNEYYSIIPLQGYGNGRLPMIDTKQNIEEQEKKLHDLFELDLSYKILLAAQANLNKISPLDYLYRSINCQFEAMNRNDLDSQLILRYIWTSAAHIQVEQIFKMARANDDERLFQRNLDNHYLLWHGTNICNLISILSRGLLVRPLSATTTGSLFGKGIYTADVFAKGLQYCSGVRIDYGERCFMLLCEVALGTSQEIFDYHQNSNEILDLKEYQSRKAHGGSVPDPRHTITRDYGVRMPLGQLVRCTDPKHSYHRSTYNEYIVFDESQIALRYLVQFRK